MKKLALIIIVCLFATGCASTTNTDTPEQQQHTISLSHHKYISDLDQYGVIEKWTPSLTGDCEDYALYMQNLLGGQLLVVKTDTGINHVVLQVGDQIIDNMSRRVYPLSSMTHKLIVKVPTTSKFN